MTTALSQRVDTQAAALERVLIQGDLSKLTEADRIGYYRAVCGSLGLNPLTKPFDYITLNGKLTLYAKKDATDQLRRLYGVSITSLESKRVDDVYVVTAHAITKEGREDSSTGAVTIANLKGDNLANALMKAETKAKRRVTLSICGLGLLDETEVETTGAAPYAAHSLTIHNPSTGEITEVALTTPEQVKTLISLGNQLGSDEAFLQGQLHVKNLTDVTAERMGKSIARLRELVAQQQRSAPTHDPQAPMVTIPDLNNASWQQEPPVEAYANDSPDDLDEALGFNDPPPAHPATTPIHQPVQPGQQITEPQMKKLRASAYYDKKWKDNQLADFIMENFGCEMQELSKREASAAIEMLAGKSN